MTPAQRFEAFLRDLLCSESVEITGDVRAALMERARRELAQLKSDLGDEQDFVDAMVDVMPLAQHGFDALAYESDKGTTREYRFERMGRIGEAKKILSAAQDAIRARGAR